MTVRLLPAAIIELEAHHALRNVSDHEPHLDGLAEGKILSLAAGGDRRLVELNGPRVVVLVDVHDHRLEHLADTVLEDGRLDRRHDSALVLLCPSTRLLHRGGERWQRRAGPLRYLGAGGHSKAHFADVAVDEPAERGRRVRVRGGDAGVRRPGGRIAVERQVPGPAQDDGRLAEDGRLLRDVRVERADEIGVGDAVAPA